MSTTAVTAHKRTTTDGYVPFFQSNKKQFTSKKIKKGEYFTKDNIKSVRPGYGLSTKYYKDIIGKQAACDIDYAEPLQEYMVNWNTDNNKNI